MSNNITFTGGGFGRTWEPTMRLRWHLEVAYRKINDRGDALAVEERVLQQLWRCNDTHATEWRPIEVEA